MTTRCMNCNGILTRTDAVCYSCGDPVPKWVKKSSVPRQNSKRHSRLGNIMFLASIALTAYSLLAPSKPPLELSLAASGVLLLGKLVLDWTERRSASADRT